VALALIVGWVLHSIGLDLRKSFLGLWGIETRILGPYVKLNALMVGMIMGFAIIPIIYTVSEDALSSVPNSLRSASLGAGATPWQTAVRVVLPVAMSGIFSACMIGFGRAAGETMIVLMLSGRTPIVDLTVFNGLSALSANIATEMPEAPVGSTHYRLLFLSTLVLFAMTFVVNTAAEVVRARFRKRAYQL
jgi:phosphate transport system permease protein